MKTLLSVRSENIVGPPALLLLLSYKTQSDLFAVEDVSHGSVTVKVSQRTEGSRLKMF